MDWMFSCVYFSADAGEDPPVDIPVDSGPDDRGDDDDSL